MFLICEDDARNASYSMYIASNNNSPTNKFTEVPIVYKQAN